eukprot:scpid96374/ scgid13425/ 
MAQQQQAGSPPRLRPCATLDKFDGSASADWTTWIAHFRQVSRVNAWTQQEQVDYLPLYLVGNAQSYYGSLTDVAQGDIAQLVATLEGRFSPAVQVDVHRAELKARLQY